MTTDNLPALPELPPPDPATAPFHSLPQIYAYTRAYAIAARAQGWRPISEAPRDGVPFVTANFSDPLRDGGEYEIARYNPRSYDRYVPAGDGLFRKEPHQVSEFDSDNFHRATHWQPLPPPPEPQT